MLSSGAVDRLVWIQTGNEPGSHRGGTPVVRPQIPAAGSSPAAGANRPAPLPAVSPTPQQISRTGHDVPLTGSAEIVVGEGTDAAAKRLLSDVLRAHGVQQPQVRTQPSGRAPLTVLLGEATRPDVAKALGGTEVPDHAEGYATAAVWVQ